MHQSDYILRLATIEDRDAISPLMVSFKEESAYKELPTEEESILSTIEEYIKRDKKQCTVVLALIEDKIVGIIVGVASKLPFNSLYQALETVWYVIPECRNTYIGLSLYKAFSYWAINIVNAKVIHTASPKGSKLGKIYRKDNYKMLEEVYIKVLT